MKRSIIGRADLLDLLNKQPSSKIKTFKDLLGFEPEQKNTIISEASLPALETKAGSGETVAVKSKPIKDVSFWYAAEYRTNESNEQAQEKIKKAIEPPEPIVIDEPEYQYLANWECLESRLRLALAHTSKSNRLDTAKIIGQLAQGQILSALPYEEQSGWGNNLQIIDDRHKHLAPYLDDYQMVQRQLSQLFLDDSLEIAFWDSAFQEPLIQVGETGLKDYSLPIGRRVLILSDLGCTAQDAGRLKNKWCQLGRRLRAAKCHAVVLLPCPAKLCGPELNHLFELISWEHPSPSLLTESQEVEACEQILNLLAPTWRFSSGLLRAMRLSIPVNTPPAYIESLIWQHPATINSNLTTSALKTEESMQRYQEFNELDNNLQKKVLNKIRAWHYDLPIEIWYATLWNLPEKAQAVVSAEELKKAQQFLSHIANRCQDDSNQPLGLNARAWVDRNLNRLSDSAKNNPALIDTITVLTQAREQWQKTDEEATGFNGCLNVSHLGSDLLLSPIGKNEEKQGSPILLLNSGNGTISLETLPDKNDPEFWTTGEPPAWADNWGHDHYGPWVEFVLNDICQRMRWINPGNFFMGALENERSFYKQESWDQGFFDQQIPQHKVTLTQGFWIFDTTVSQGLWQTVMKDNPSKFKHPENPVENVSWNDCQEFIYKINQQLPGLDLTFPSEAQWEYACRAGTGTTFSFGEEIDLTQVNFSSSDKKGEFLNKTAAVKAYPPNPWGLYQMHGNVLEWCLDGLREFTENSVKDPLGATGAGTERVLRGGSWYGTARSCRSAARSRNRPDLRSVSIGFRCARVQASQAKEAQPALEGGSRTAEQGRFRVEGRGGASKVRVIGETQQAYLKLPQKASRLLLRSDREQLLLQKRTKPDWASAMGRDRYGLWAEFSLDSEHDTVVQRMRWIPPGQFLMGSTDDEEGRWKDEGPQHSVVISQGYWLFDTPVTQALWQVIMGSNPSNFKGLDRPVETVRWDDCQQFIDKINQLKPALQLILPSESQWEYACRASTSTPFNFGTEISDAVVNYHSNQIRLRELKTLPVKQLPANQWGLYQMHGNVREWTADRWHNNYQGAPEDGSVWEDDADPRRVLRGGSWYFTARYCRSAARSRYRPDRRNDGIGFRCARVQA